MLSRGSCFTGRSLSHGADDFRPRVGGAWAMLSIIENRLDHHERMEPLNCFIVPFNAFYLQLNRTFLLVNPSCE